MKEHVSSSYSLIVHHSMVCYNLQANLLGYNFNQISVRVIIVSNHFIILRSDLYKSAVSIILIRIYLIDYNII